MRNALSLAKPMMVVASLLSTTILSTAHAEDTRPLTSLDTVTVISTKSARATFDVPAMVTVIDSASADIAGAGTPKELLSDINGVEFGGSARSNGQDIKMRGYGTEGIIILLDGVRQKFDSRHDGRFFIDSQLIKTVEVVKGPNSALYGSGGLGGVIAFKTKDAADLLAPGENKGATTTLGYQTVDNEWMASQSGYARSEDWDILANVVTRHSSDIDLGNGTTLESEEDVVSGLLKASWTPKDNHTFRFSTQLFNIKAEEPNNPDGGNDPASLTNKDIVTTTTKVAYEYSDPENEWLNLKTQAYYVETDKEEEILAPSAVHAVGDVIKNNVETIGFSIENQSRFGEADSTTQVLTYGAEIYNESMDGGDSGNVGGDSDHYPDAEADTWGIFAQDEISFQTAAGEFLVIPGVRFDHYESEDTNGNNSDESELSPKLGLTYKPNDWLMLFGNYAHAFRAPNMEELYPTGVHFTIPGLGTNTFVPNPNLRPETSDTIEVGFGLKFNDVIKADDAARIKASYYKIDSEDYINRYLVGFNPRSPSCCGTAVTSNIDSASLRGYEIEGQYENDRLKFGAGLAYITGKDDNSGAYVGDLAPLTVKTSLTVKIPEADSLAGWKAIFANQQDHVNSATDIRSGYAVHDMYYQWKPEEHENVTLNLGIDNVFDKSYDRAFAGSKEPGRNYKVQVSFTW